ncbi:MAG TPA: ABC transporter substrate-binding protein [Myxococcota bacterium]|nr:ABC transporter substrate-binding protein [Myxococcota bacterium]
MPALLLAGCAPVAEREAHAPHPTIVSLNPCTDAILAEVAAPGQLLALSHYSHDPRASSMPLAEARRFHKTGGTVEEVLALGPDLVVGDPFMAPATRAAFARLGIRVETVGIAASVAESEAQVRRLAALAGNPAAGERLVTEIVTGLAEARRSGPPVPALLWQQGGLVPGEGTLAAELLAHTGFASHSAARGLGQGAYLPLEHVLADPPDVVLAAGEGRAQAHPVLASLRKERLDPALLYCGGPTIPKLARRLAAVRDGHKPLPFRGGVGVGGGPVTYSPDSPHPPTPSPEGEGEI